MTMAGLAACAPSIAFRIGAILSVALSALPLTSNWTRAEWRSADTSPACGKLIGETTFVTLGWPARVCTTVATAAAKTSSPTVAVGDWTSTLSRAGILKLAWSRICSARRDCPFEIAQSFICLAPTAPPTPTARIAKAIQPNAASFQCAALHRPARPARLMVFMAHALSFAGADLPNWRIPGRRRGFIGGGADFRPENYGSEWPHRPGLSDTVRACASAPSPWQGRSQPSRLRPG
jgi:hypothetical protein